MGTVASVRQPQSLRVEGRTPLVARVALHQIVWPHLVVTSVVRVAQHQRVVVPRLRVWLALVLHNSVVTVSNLAQLVKTQTDLVAAQTRAMSAQTLPPMSHFSGEGVQSGEDGFDCWLEQFEERVKLVGWSEDHKKYQLKMLLDRNVFQAYRLLTDSVKSSCQSTVEALQKKFKPVDIEELRGLEFHQLTQVSQSNSWGLSYKS